MASLHTGNGPEELLDPPETSGGEGSSIQSLGNVVGCNPRRSGLVPVRSSEHRPLPSLAPGLAGPRSCWPQVCLAQALFVHPFIRPTKSLRGRGGQRHSGRVSGPGQGPPAESGTPPIQSSRHSPRISPSTCCHRRDPVGSARCSGRPVRPGPRPARRSPRSSRWP